MPINIAATITATAAATEIPTTTSLWPDSVGSLKDKIFINTHPLKNYLIHIKLK
jgi:hypothetical protein